MKKEYIQGKSGKLQGSQPGRRKGSKPKMMPSDIRGMIRELEVGHLDRRRRMVRLIDHAKEVLGHDPEEAMLAVLEHDIATNLAVQQIIMKHVHEQDELFDGDGDLIPALSNHLLKYQDMNRKALAELNRLHDKLRSQDRQKKQRTVNVADLVLDHSEGGEDDN